MDLFDDMYSDLLRSENLPTLPPPPGEAVERRIFEMTWEAFRNRRLLPLLRAAKQSFIEHGLLAGVRLENGSVVLTVARESASGVWSDRRERTLSLNPRAGKVVVGSCCAGWEMETFDLLQIDEVVLDRKLRIFAGMAVEALAPIEPAPDVTPAVPVSLVALV